MIAPSTDASNDRATDASAGPVADIAFWFDPVCPFAWMTSKWVRQVQRQRRYTVEWRPISLRLMNAHIDYDSHFPPEYEAGHTAGLRLLRVVEAVREAHGHNGVDRLQPTLGEALFEVDKTDVVKPVQARGQIPFAQRCLAAAGLPGDLAVAVEDGARDAAIQASTDAAFALTGKDVGTPIIQFQPPDGVAFFGPVISRLPDPAQAAQLWDHVVGLAGFPGFAELKRSLRERPQLPALGVPVDQTGMTEDWHAGSRRQKR